MVPKAGYSTAFYLLAPNPLNKGLIHSQTFSGSLLKIRIVTYLVYYCTRNQAVEVLQKSLNTCIKPSGERDRVLPFVSSSNSSCDTTATNL